MTKPIALLGATGMVGQTLIHLSQLSEFSVREVIGASKRVGKQYGDEVSWLLASPMPEDVKGLVFKSVEEIESRYVVSALPADVAKDIESKLALKGHVVVSNSAAHRLDPNACLVVPEVNGEQLKKINKNQGTLITNPNCVVAILSVVLAPLMEQNLLESLSLTTLQSASGAGYPGISSMDLLGNVIPFINGEEEKIVEELRHIFNVPQLPISAQCNRVPVRVGHMISCDVTFKENVSQEVFVSLLEAWSNRHQGVLKLVTDHQDLPQPLKTLEPYDMAVYVGRIQKKIQQNQLPFVVLGDNLGRGAAGAALANLTLFDRLYA